jgi:hypothetical protein
VGSAANDDVDVVAQDGSPPCHHRTPGPVRRVRRPLFHPPVFRVIMAARYSPRRGGRKRPVTVTRNIGDAFSRRAYRLDVDGTMTGVVGSGEGVPRQTGCGRRTRS